MIEPGDVLDTMTPKKKQPATVRVNKRYNEPPRPRPQASVAEPVKHRQKSPAPAKSRMQFAMLATLTYLLGPLAILLTPRGRAQKLMVLLAGLSVAATVVLVRERLGGLVQGDQLGSVWLWYVLVAVAVFGGFTAWARALHLIGLEGIPNVNKLPHWLRRGWAIGGLSLIAPGSGMLLSGRADRASLTVWLLSPVVFSAVILLNAAELWQHHMTGGWLASFGPALEISFMIGAWLTAVGFLGYIAQALEGLREFLVEPGLKTRVKGDYYAVAVMVAMVVMVIVANPVQMAHQLDVGGDILREDGFQMIPLQLTLASFRLDPSKPEYSLQAVELYTELGRTDKADALRSDLDRNLGPYVAMVQQEAVAESGPARTQSPPDKSQSANFHSFEDVVSMAKQWAKSQSYAKSSPPAVVVGPSLYPGPLGQEDELPGTSDERGQRVTQATALGLPVSDK